jgi:DNA-binding transcriptional ArsR family regulator
VLASSLASGCRRRATPEAEVPAPAGLPTPQIDPWKQAALKVEESRGEPAGRQAKPDVPEELKQYKDRRRFLSIQVAEWREQKFDTPHDFAALVDLIRRGEFTEVPALGDDYILYGVGLNVSDEPLTHYDKAAGKSVTLYGTDADFEQDYAPLKDSLAQRRDEIDALAKELAKLTKKDRDRRKSLTEEIAEKRRDADAIKSRMDLLDSYYRDPEKRKMLADEYEGLSGFARDFGGKSYDLQDPASRREFKARLLAYARPPALAMLKEIAHTYREKFGRHLPVTSLVRTDEYQRQLNAVNPNATLIETAPHTTGLAFDIYYHFMSKGEQEFVMNDLARLEDAGRVEALRELRDHFHVFAFAEGRPPDEKLVEQQMKQGGGRNGGEGEKAAKEEESSAKMKKEGRAAKATRDAKSKGGAKAARASFRSRGAKVTRAARGRH